MIRTKTEFAEGKFISDRSAGVLAEIAESGSASSERQRAGRDSTVQRVSASCLRWIRAIVEHRMRIDCFSKHLIIDDINN